MTTYLTKGGIILTYSPLWQGWYGTGVEKKVGGFVSIVRKQKVNVGAQLCLLFMLPETSAHEMVFPTFRVGLLTSVSLV